MQGRGVTFERTSKARPVPRQDIVQQVPPGLPEFARVDQPVTIALAQRSPLLQPSAFSPLIAMTEH